MYLNNITRVSHKIPKISSEDITVYIPLIRDGNNLFTYCENKHITSNYVYAKNHLNAWDVSDEKKADWFVPETLRNESYTYYDLNNIDEDFIFGSFSTNKNHVYWLKCKIKKGTEYYHTIGGSYVSKYLVAEHIIDLGSHRNDYKTYSLELFGINIY